MQYSGRCFCPCHPAALTSLRRFVRHEIELKDIQTLLHAYGPLLVFANVLLEQAGLPIPAYPILIAAGALAVHGDMSWAGVLLAAVMASLIADAAWYLGGKRFGGGLLETVCRVSLSRDSCIRQTQALYLRVGPRLLLVAKFLPGAGALSTVMSGLTGVPLRKFLLYDLAGSAIWAGSALLIGVAFNDALAQVVDMLGQYGGMGLAILAAALLVYIAYRIFRRKYTVRRLRHVPRVSLDELDAWLADGRIPVLLDVRAGAPDPMPGAIAVDPHVPFDAQIFTFASDPGAYIVVYCACPEEISAAILADKLRRAGYANTWALAGGYNAWRARTGQVVPGQSPPEVQDVQEA